MNHALRHVGSYHLETDDTTSATYEIASRAYEEAILALFAENTFEYNTRRQFSTGTDTSTLSDSAKPSDFWSYRHTLNSGGPTQLQQYETLVKVTNKEGNLILDWVLDEYAASGTTYGEVPYLFTTEKDVHIYHSFIPNLDNETGSSRGDRASSLPAHLVRPLILYMAQAMAIELSGSENRQVLLYQQYERSLRRARVVDSRSSPAQRYIHDGNSQLINSHYGYGSV